MRILVFGTGVIGSNLAADLFASGRDVTILARGEWADTLDKNGLLIDPIFSPWKKTYRIPVIRELGKDCILLTLIMIVLLWVTMKKSIREHTIANGDPVCDYWIVGNQIKGVR